MQVLLLLLVMAVSLWIGATFWPKLRDRFWPPLHVVVVFDDMRLRAFYGVNVSGGIEITLPDKTKVIYAPNVYRYVKVSYMLHVYLVLAEPFALATHEELERSRGVTLSKSIFRSGGDLLRYFQIGAAVIPIIAVIWMSMQVGGLQDRINAVDASVQVVRQIVSSPMQVAPAPTPEP